MTNNKFVRVPKREGSKQEDDHTGAGTPSKENTADTDQHTTFLKSGVAQTEDVLPKSKQFSLNIIVQCQKFSTQIDDFKAECTVRRKYLIWIADTWLDSENTDHEVCVDGYEIIRLDRNRSEGHVPILNSRNLTCKTIIADTLTECYKLVISYYRAENFAGHKISLFSRY